MNCSKTATSIQEVEGVDTKLSERGRLLGRTCKSHNKHLTFTCVKLEVILKCQDLLEESSFSALLSLLSIQQLPTNT